MAKELDIDRSLPASREDPAPASAAGEGPDDQALEEAPRPLPRVRTRVGPLKGAAATEDEAPQLLEAPARPPRPRRKRRPIGPVLSGFNNEQLSLLAGITMTMLFVFLYFAIYEAESDPGPLLYYTLAASIITAVALWFYMRADRLVREQANFIAGILGVLGLVFIWLGVDRFAQTAWKMVVSVVLTGLATICFFAGQVLQQR